MNLNSININVIKSQLLTQKSNVLLKNYFQYTFIIHKFLNKKQIKIIFENLFNLKIQNINTCVLPLKTSKKNNSVGKLPQYKKIFIKFKSNEILSYFLNN